MLGRMDDLLYDGFPVARLSRYPPATGGGLETRRIEQTRPAPNSGIVPA